MIRVTLKGLLARKLRLALTSLAIVLGVGMVCGTFILTDTVNAGVHDIIGGAYAKADAVVSAKAVFGGGDVNSFPQSTLGRIRALEDVRSAGGEAAGQAEIIGANGKVVSRASGSEYGLSIDPAYARFSALHLVAGAWPHGPGQVAIDQQTADSEHYGAGSHVDVIADGARERRYDVSGIVDFGGSTSLAGGTIAVFDLPTAQRLFGERHGLDQIDVAARPGVATAALLAQIRTVLPPHTRVRTGGQQAQAAFNDSKGVLDTFRDFLLAFAGIALFVGAFVIANTLSITVAQRARELATLRTLGATARQVRFTVVLEGLMTGLVASLAGLVVGVGLARGLEALFDALGADLPLTGLVFATRTIVVSLLVGTLVTALASLVPAVRATRVPPIAAVREGSMLPPSRLARFGPAAAGIVAAVAIALICVGAFGSGISTGPRLLLIAIGVLALFVAMAMAAPSIARPVALVLGWPASRVGGAAGRLARANAVRNPARTASTAAALMIGLALVTAVAVLAQGLKQSIVGSVESEFRGNYVMTSVNGFTPMSIAATGALHRAGVATVIAGERSGNGRIFGHTVQVAGIDPGLSQLLRLRWTAGSDAAMAHLGAAGAIVDKSFARSHHLAVGSPLRLETSTGKVLALRVTAINDPPASENPLGTISISSRTFDSVYTNPENVFTLIATRGGVTAANTHALDRVTARFPDARVQSETEFLSSQEGAIQSQLNLLYILLAISVIVSLFGIVNTLVLTVFERTREIGMLRAIGMSRRQTRRMIRHEAVITCLLGALLGIPVGIGIAAILDRALQGGIPFAVPVGTVAVFVVSAVVVGLVAAIFPARRAARLDILHALQYE
ncbi:MAG TPA: FtsX-like permease family protein [Gaiellales bacterium]|nr:FtsX-like permease family protein [Gaiellales bacterium]